MKNIRINHAPQDSRELKETSMISETGSLRMRGVRFGRDEKRRNKTMFMFSTLTLCHLLVILLSCSKETPEVEDSRMPSPPPVTGKEIIERVNSRHLGRDSIKEVTMKLIRSDGKEKTRHMKVYQTSSGRLEILKTLYLFTSPKNLKGISLLIHEPSPSREGMGEGQDHLWLYLPAFDKVFEIKNPYRGHNILGTDLSYEDSKQFLSLTDFDYQFLREEKLNGKLCSVIEALPTSPEIVEETRYSRSLWWIQKDIWVVLQAQFYDKYGKLLKTYRADRFEKIKKIWTPRLVSMENHKTLHKTLLETEDVQYNKDLQESIFRKESLGQLGTSE
jgi:hypothetical protein